MNVQIRPLRLEDIDCVAKVERQAFPTLWPPTPFKRELDNRLAKYLVAWEPNPSEATHPDRSEPTGPPDSPHRSLLGRAMDIFRGRRSPDKTSEDTDCTLLGFVGLWFMSGEAHITGIAVEKASRGKGIGELLIIGSIELAMARNATVMSLEARVSNFVAQALYEKYGFQNVGIRKGYYTDNREDAVIMTTNPISDTSYRDKFHALKNVYRQRYGEIKIQLP